MLLQKTLNIFGARVLRYGDGGGGIGRVVMHLCSSLILLESRLYLQDNSHEFIHEK